MMLNVRLRSFITRKEIENTQDRYFIEATKVTQSKTFSDSCKGQKLQSHNNATIC